MKEKTIVAVSSISGVFPARRFESISEAESALEDAGFTQKSDSFKTFSHGESVAAFTDGFNGAVGIFEVE